MTLHEHCQHCSHSLGHHVHANGHWCCFATRGGPISAQQLPKSCGQAKELRIAETGGWQLAANAVWLGLHTFPNGTD